MSNDTQKSTGSFTFRNGNTEINTPAPTQSAWDLLLAVLVGAAIATAAGMAQANCHCRDDD